jgi:hypothetical protein
MFALKTTRERTLARPGNAAIRKAKCCPLHLPRTIQPKRRTGKPSDRDADGPH